MRLIIERLILASALVWLIPTGVYAHPSTNARGVLSLVEGQGGTTSAISGVVSDAAGGVIPGATVVVANKANGTKFNVVTNSSGAFSVPALDAGTYTVTVSLTGFKTAIVDDVKLQPGTPASIKALLEVGSLNETVVVLGSSDLVNTQTATVSSNLNVDQINRMPLATRNALNAVTFLPGVNTAGVNRDSNVNGLPQSFINITLDGVSNNDNFNKTSDGFFAMVTPRQDAVEAVTVTMAAGGADIGGHGAVGINFVTRSGTNRFTGSFELRFDVLNVFDNINFNVTDGSRTPGSGATIFQSGSAYTDLSNTFDPGGRLGMLVFRLNW